VGRLKHRKVETVHQYNPNPYYDRIESDLRVAERVAKGVENESERTLLGCIRKGLLSLHEGKHKTCRRLL